MSNKDLNDQVEQECREVLESLGALAATSTIINKLNKVFAHTEDRKLQALLGDLINKIPISGGVTKHTPLRYAHAIPTKEIELHCRSLLGMDPYQEPVSKY
ncbi:hypothetical protein [uncultured Amphritea sp.]|uniref:hypothetical protein n=1 Tax=uncultured Amphritea sp. TaxID=981605 RepID=UPI00262943EB|nr:hypothetical protein [uncultured Amphritea sp.]